MKLKCKECEIEYEKPDYFKEESERKAPSHFYFKRAITYCDKCRRVREREMLKSLPKVIEAIANMEEIK